MQPRLFRPIVFALAGLAWATAVQAQQFSYTINSPDTNTVTIYGADSPDAASGLTTLYIPDSIYVSERTNFLPVTSIGYQAFADKNYTNLASVRLPSGIKSLEFKAFRGLPKLKSIPLPYGLVRIGEGSLSGCPLLTNFTIPSSVTSIEVGAFGINDSLTSMTIPDSVTNLERGAFIGCGGLKNVTLGSGVRAISDQTFESCVSLANFTIPINVKSIGDWAFHFCVSLRSIGIPSGVTNIGTYAFYACTNLTTLAISNAATPIREGAFGYCSRLTSCTISGVTSIGWYAFSPSGLTNLIIPSSVTNIEAQAFDYCAGLKTVYFLGDAPSISGGPFWYSTLYYLPGAANWTSPFGGRPALLWNPQVRTDNSNFGMRANRFGFTVTGTADIPITIEATYNLAPATWVSLKTCTLTNGSFYFSDPASVNYPRRTYHIRSP